MVNTRSKRHMTNPTSGPPKRRRQRAAELERSAGSNNVEDNLDSPSQRNPQPSGSHLPSQSTPRVIPDPDSQARNPFNLDLADLTLGNYEKAMDYWPMNRINKELAAQAPGNEKLSNIVIAHAQAVLEHFEHTVHMIALIAGCSVAVLKRRLGLAGGMHGENPWHRWLSFSIEAQKHPMPVRGDENAGEILSFRNKANAAAYQKLSDDEYSIYTAPIFYALGGYPNYSAVNVTDLDNINLEEVLVPEIPQLSQELDDRYRPIYLKSVDLKKVAKDKDFNTPAVSETAIEKRSWQCYKKIATQLSRDAPLVGLDYLFIACSKSPLGQGWCHAKTTQKEFLAWLNNETKFERLFPTYAQGGGTFEAIRNSITDGKASTSKSAKPVRVQKCDQVKLALTAKLNADFVKVLGAVPRQGWPRGPNPIQALAQRKINVFIRRETECSLSDKLWELGYKAMDTVGRSAWLADYEANLFEIMPPRDPTLPPRVSGARGALALEQGTRSVEGSGSGTGGGQNLGSEAGEVGGTVEPEPETSGIGSAEGSAEASGSGTGGGENPGLDAGEGGGVGLAELMRDGVIDTWV